MSKTVATLISDLKVEVKNSGNTSVDTALRLALVRALSRLSTVKTAFTGASFLMVAQADNGSYFNTYPGFPVDAASVDWLQYSPSPYTTMVRVEQVPFNDLLAVRLGSYPLLTTGAYPFYFAFNAGFIEIAPAPPQSGALQGYYHRDARRDKVTGTLIDATVASNLLTNDWFGDGEDALWNRTLQIYHSTFAVDPERAAYYASEARDATSALEAQFERKSIPGFQSAWAL